MNRSISADVVIFGGGIIGGLAAYEVAKSGAKVLLLEKNTFGYGASGNSAAMLELQLDAHRGEPFFSLAKASHDLFPSLAQELKEKSGIDIQFSRCSILQMALNKEEAEALQKECARQKTMGLRAEWISPEQLLERYPDLSSKNYGAALFVDDGRVHGNLFLSAALTAARREGAILEERAQGYSIEAFIQAGKKVIVAAGAWTDEVLRPLNVKTGIMPVRGQLLLLDTPTPPLSCPVYTKSGAYLTPREDGVTLAGTTIENVGFDSIPTPEGKKHITQTVKALMPKILDRPVIKMTAGLRPKPVGDLPLIGPLPEFPNVFVAAGHYRNGILLAPITAKIIAAFVSAKPSPIPLDSFLPPHVSLSA